MRQLEKPPSRWSKLVPNTRKKKLTFLGVLIVIVFIVAGLIIYANSTPNHKVTHKVNQLSKPNTSCEQIRTELGSATDYNKYSVDTQKKVLEKQMLCFSDALEFDKAIAAAKKLDVIYTQEHDTANKTRVEARIQSMQAALQPTNEDSGNAQQ